MRLLRNAIQLVVAAYLLLVGWQFYLFVQHFATAGATPYVARPPAVEAFLPLSALVALRAWLGTGVLDSVHPAGLVILSAALATALLYGRGLCAWLCPLGALSEALWRCGRRLLGRSFAVPRVVDWLLQSLKYVVLAFFLKAILLDMSPAAAHYFLASAYNKVADVKMLYFFLTPGAEMASFLAALALLSFLLPNFWCRYLCPYGALLGLLGYFAPVTVRREEARCTACRRCTQACPERLIVHAVDEVTSPACTRCLECLRACPRRGALGIAVPGLRRLGRAWVYPALFLGTFFLILLAAQVAGYWQTGLTYETHRQLIPQVDSLGHP